MPYYNKRNTMNPWTGQIWKNGKIAERKSFKTKKEAVEWEVGERKNLLYTTSTVSLGEWAIRYLDDVKESKAVKTYGEKLKAFKEFFSNPEIDKNMPLDELTPALIQKHLRSQARERSGNASNKDLKNLKAAWKWASVFLGADPRNPFSVVEKAHEKREPRYIPPLEDFWKVYDACYCGQDARMLLAYFHTAARKRELFQMEWLRDVDFFNRKVQLWSRKNQRGQLEGAWIEMTEAAFELLKAQHAETGGGKFVFVDQQSGRPFTERYHWMNRMCELAGVAPFGLHAIRHLAASVMAEQGLQLVRIQAALRHKNISTTDRYISRLKKKGREAVMTLPSPNDRSIGENVYSREHSHGLDRVQLKSAK